MNEVKYYPVVSIDSDGVEKQPMFPVDDEKIVRNSHKM